MLYIIEASKLRPGQWIYNGKRAAPFRVVSVDDTEDGDVVVRHDFGNGGEPAMSRYRQDETVALT